MMSRRRSRRTPNSCQKMVAQMAVGTANVMITAANRWMSRNLGTNVCTGICWGLRIGMRGHPIRKGVSETCCFGVTAFRKGAAATALPSHCCPTATDFCGALCYIQSHWLPVLPVGGDGTDTGRWGAKARFRGGNRAFSRLEVRTASQITKRPGLIRAVLIIEPEL